MESDQNDQGVDRPFYPSGFSPEVDEEDTGYKEEFLALERSHQGPIPSPEDLDYYRQVLPDAPDRILRMAEENARSFRDLNSKVVDGQMVVEKNRHQEATIGQFFGIFSVLIMAAIAIVALIMNHPVVAGTICSTTIIGVAAVFVTGRQSKKAEPEKKAE